MTEQEIFILADQTLNGVVARIADDKGAVPHDAPLPDRLLGLTGSDPHAA